MRIARIVVALVLCLLGTAPVEAQKAVLTPEEVQAAIDRGQKKDLEDVGLQMSLDSGGVKVARFLLAPQGSYGGSMTIFSPTTWIEMISSQLAADFKTLTPGDLSSIDLEPVLRVFVDAGEIQQIVLRDSKKKIVVMPLSRDFRGIAGGAPSAGTRLIPFKGGLKLTHSPTEFQFNLEEVKGLHAKSPEIFVTVVAYGTGLERGIQQRRIEINVKLGKGQFEKLP